MTKAPTTAITIPRDMLPRDGRFGCGPSKVRDAQLDALGGEGRRL
ncbi:MAG: phosphoserine transaminase, partial [Actinobacteria bacterium]|nr:phosphoserine transaminase [Actinomycetota bacterium]